MRSALYTYFNTIEKLENKNWQLHWVCIYISCISEPWITERGHAEGQPIQIHLPGTVATALFACYNDYYSMLSGRQ